jgi:hypothetical protein
LADFPHSKAAVLLLERGGELPHSTRANTRDTIKGRRDTCG